MGGTYLRRGRPGGRRRPRNHHYTGPGGRTRLQGSRVRPTTGDSWTGLPGRRVTRPPSPVNDGRRLPGDVISPTGPRSAPVPTRTRRPPGRRGPGPWSGGPTPRTPTGVRGGGRRLSVTAPCLQCISCPDSVPAVDGAFISDNNRSVSRLPGKGLGKVGVRM